MPRFLAIGENVIGGTATINNAKTLSVNFVKLNGTPVSYLKAPRVSLTMLDESLRVPYKMANNKSGNLYTGFTLGFSQKVTVGVEWIAWERE